MLLSSFEGERKKNSGLFSLEIIHAPDTYAPVCIANDLRTLNKLSKVKFVNDNCFLRNIVRLCFRETQSLLTFVSESCVVRYKLYNHFGPFCCGFV